MSTHFLFVIYLSKSKKYDAVKLYFETILILGCIKYLQKYTQVSGEDWLTMTSLLKKRKTEEK